MTPIPMPDTPLVVAPGPKDRTVRLPDGTVRTVPDGWELVPPGDAALTRRIKAGGPCWVVQEKKGRRAFSRGVYAAADRVAAIRTALAAERDDPAYAKKLAAGRARREREQATYVEDFAAAVRAFLAFAPQHDDLAAELTRRVTAHATPVGSGTVARTQRVPVEERAEAAVIAWMRHHTTAYDHMSIPRIKGQRRKVRRMLAARSRELLDGYRGKGDPAPGVECPLRRALGESAPTGT